jgi:hypothetical protein
MLLCIFISNFPGPDKVLIDPFKLHRIFFSFSGDCSAAIFASSKANLSTIEMPFAVAGKFFG